MNLGNVIVFKVGLNHPVELEKVLGNLLEQVVAEVEDWTQLP